MVFRFLFRLNGMGDVASSLISASTEEILRESACAEGNDF